MFTVFPYIPTPIYTIGLQYQATWRALCLGLRIRHVSRGEGESFVPQNPLNSQGPCSLVVVLRPELPPVLRPACLRSSRSAYLRFLLRPELPPVQGPRAFGFRGPRCLRLGFSYLQPKSLLAPTQILMYSYINSHSYKTVEHCYSYSYSLLHNCCMLL